jgi:hypothetical protein
MVSRLAPYPCSGTGGDTASARVKNESVTRFHRRILVIHLLLLSAAKAEGRFIFARNTGATVFRSRYERQRDSSPAVGQIRRRG